MYTSDAALQYRKISRGVKFAHVGADDELFVFARHQDEAGRRFLFKLADNVIEFAQHFAAQAVDFLVAAVDIQPGDAVQVMLQTPVLIGGGIVHLSGRCGHCLGSMLGIDQKIGNLLSLAAVQTARTDLMRLKSNGSMVGGFKVPEVIKHS